jgi:uncharacterized MAPEG superfamily protein
MEKTLLTCCMVVALLFPTTAGAHCYEDCEEVSVAQSNSKPLRIIELPPPEKVAAPTPPPARPDRAAESPEPTSFWVTVAETIGAIVAGIIGGFLFVSLLAWAYLIFSRVLNLIFYILGFSDEL